MRDITSRTVVNFSINITPLTVLSQLPHNYQHDANAKLQGGYNSSGMQKNIKNCADAIKILLSKTNK
jgi:hypothetical protein